MRWKRFIGALLHRSGSKAKRLAHRTNRWREKRAPGSVPSFGGKKRSVMITLLLSYLAILLLPAVIGFVLYDKMEAAMIRSATNANFALLEQARQVMDQKMEEVNRMTVQIGLNSKLQLLIGKKQVNNSSDMSKFMDFIDDISKYQWTSNNFIMYFFIYMNESGTVVTPSMKADERTFFRQIMSFPDEPDPQFVPRMLASGQWSSFYPSERVQFNDGQGGRVIPYIRSLPLDEPGNPKGSLVVLINEAQVQDMLDRIVRASSGSIYILGPDRQTILTTDSAGTDAPFADRQLQGTQGVFAAGIGGEDMMVSYTRSEHNGWTYISVVPKKVILANILTIKSWAIAILLCYLAAGAACCRYLAQRHYRPVRELVQAIAGGRKLPRQRTENEFDLIRSTLSTSLSEEKQLRQTLSRQAPVIQSDFISRLLRGQVDILRVTEADLDFMGVRFETSHFRVAIVEIEDCSRFVRENTERERTLVRFIVANLASELLERPSYAIELESGRLGLLLCCEAEPDDGKRKRHVETFATGLMNYMETRFKTRLTVAVSELHAGLEAIADCYGEAVMALDYKMIKGGNTALYYGDIKSLESLTYHYPLETEIRLMNFVKSGEEEQADKLLEQIFELNVHADQATPELVSCLCSDLYATLLKLRNTLAPEEQRRLRETDGDPARFLSSCGTREDMLAKLKAGFRTVCLLARRERPDHGEQLYNRIVAYVQEHYQDSALSLTSLSEQLNLNPSYLSAFFKKHSKRNLSDYIAEIRIGCAKEMMKDEQLTILEIARRVGYANDVGFIRVFKKAEGIPPGKYRKTVMPE